MNRLLMTDDREVNWQPEDYVLFRKCGEITVSPDKQCFGLNCLFCPGICLQFDIFMQHLREQHDPDIAALYSEANDQQREQLTGPNVVESNKNPEKKDLPQNAINSTNLEMANNKLLQTRDKANNTKIVHFFKVNEQEEPNATITTTIAGTKQNNLNAMLDVLMQPEVPQEEVDLVYFVENALPVDLLPMTVEAEMEKPMNSFELLNEACYTKYNGDDYEHDYDNNEDSSVVVFSGFNGSGGEGGVGGAGKNCVPLEEGESTDNYTNDNDGKEEKAKCITNSTVTSSRDKIPKTSAMREAEQNKDIIIYLLDAYRKNEKLWNPKHPEYKYNARRSVFNELSGPLFRDMNCALSGAEIFGILNELRGRYRRELIKFRVRKGKHKTRLWYFEQMDFLRNVIESKRAERQQSRDKADHHYDGSERSMNINIDFSNRQVLSYLLEAFREHECLWNPKHPNYSKCNKVALFEDISARLQDHIHISMSGAECFNEIQKLRLRYRRELRILYKLKGLYIPKLWCFDEMDFLRSVFDEQIHKRMNKPVGKRLFSRSKGEFLSAKDIVFKDMEEHLQFIEIYRNYSALWDVDHPDYRSASYRSKALHEMLAEVNYTFTSGKQPITLDQLEKALFLLRKHFSAEKQRFLNSEENGNKNESSRVSSASASGRMSSVIYGKLCEFLEINLGPFRCETCRQMCKTYDQYKMHKSGHDGTMPFVCTLCGKGFQMPGNLTIHIRRHRRDFPYGCEVCTKTFATSTEVSIHMRSHTGERPYVCELCGKTFKTWSFYNIHRRTHLKQSNFHCPICDKGFYERNRFTDHMNVHLNIRKHACDECGKSFTTCGNLKKHLELHAPVKKYKCVSCGRSFAQFASLRWHRRNGSVECLN